MNVDESSRKIKGTGGQTYERTPRESAFIKASAMTSEGGEVCSLQIHQGISSRRGKKRVI